MVKSPHVKDSTVHCGEHRRDPAGHTAEQRELRRHLPKGRGTGSPSEPVHHLVLGQQRPSGHEEGVPIDRLRPVRL